MLEEINKDIVNAMKSKDTHTLDTLRMLKGAIELDRINRRLDKLSDEDIIGITEKQIKIRKESIVEFKKGNREDLVNKTEEEIEILSKYMPDALSDIEIENIIDTAVKDLNATSIKDMGNVMKEVSPKLKGRADMSFVSNLIKNKLN